MKRTVVKKTISLRPDVWEYVSSQSQDNASSFINEALRAYRKQQLHRKMVQGYKAMALDKRFVEDMSLWDTTLLDGLDDEGHPAR